MPLHEVYKRLERAVALDDPEQVQTCIQYLPRDQATYYALRCAIAEHKHTVFERLIEGYDASEGNYVEGSLMLWTYRHHPEQIEKVLPHASDLNVHSHDANRNTLLHYAALRHNPHDLALVKALRENPRVIAQRNRHGFYPDDIIKNELDELSSRPKTDPEITKYLKGFLAVLESFPKELRGVAEGAAPPRP